MASANMAVIIVQKTSVEDLYVNGAGKSEMEAIYLWFL